MNDFSLFYLDHSFANAAKPRSRSVIPDSCCFGYHTLSILLTYCLISKLV